MSEYINEREKIIQEIKRLNCLIKELRINKKETEQKIVEFMEERDMEILDGVALSDLKPNSRKKRKKKSEKREDALEFLKNYDIDEPETFYLNFMKTQSF